MMDALALIAVSQLVCIGAIGYLYLQLQAVRREKPQRVRRSPRVQSLEHPVQAVTREASSRAAREAYAASSTQQAPRPMRPTPEGGHVDIAELARRMNRSEEEVRLLMRRRGAA